MNFQHSAASTCGVYISVNWSGTRAPEFPIQIFSIVKQLNQVFVKNYWTKTDAQIVLYTSIKTVKKLHKFCYFNGKKTAIKYKIHLVHVYK